MLVLLQADRQPAVQAEHQQVGGQQAHLRPSPSEPGDLAEDCDVTTTRNVMTPPDIR